MNIFDYFQTNVYDQTFTLITCDKVELFLINDNSGKSKFNVNFQAHINFVFNTRVHGETICQIKLWHG